MPASVPLKPLRSNRAPSPTSTTGPPRIAPAITPLPLVVVPPLSDREERKRRRLGLGKEEEEERRKRRRRVAGSGRRVWGEEKKGIGCVGEGAWVRGKGLGENFKSSLVRTIPRDVLATDSRRQVLVMSSRAVLVICRISNSVPLDYLLWSMVKRDLVKSSNVHLGQIPLTKLILQFFTPNSLLQISPSPIFIPIKT